MSKKQKFFALHGSSREAAHFWGTYLYEGGLEVREVSARDLGAPSLHTPGNLFRAAHDFAVKQSFAGAYPTFRKTGSDYSAKYELVLLSEEIAEPVTYPADVLEQPEKHDPGHLFRCFHRHSWVDLDRRQTAFPNFHRVVENDRVLYAGIQLKPQVGVHTRIFERDLGNLAPEDLAAHMRAVHELALKKGFATGITTGHSPHPESEFFHNFNSHWGIRHLVENEGWMVVRVDSLGSQLDGEGFVHFAATVVLEKED